MLGFLNIASLLLGLAAWALPLCTIVTRRYRAEYSSVSFALCALALLLQLMQVQNLVRKQDWSALMDTWYAVVFAGVVLLLVNVALHIAAFVIGKHRK